MISARGLKKTFGGRVAVEADLSLPGHPEVLAIGDMVTLRKPDGSALVLPGLAPVAMQQGRHAARVVADRVAGRTPHPFHYHDKGNLATIGRASAVADVKGVQLSGFLAWVTWLVVHLWYLIGFQNRLIVLVRWSFSFFGHGRGARLIAPEPGEPRVVMLERAEQRRLTQYLVVHGLPPSPPLRVRTSGTRAGQPDPIQSG